MNPKSEYLNPKWFDQLTTLSQVEGQIQLANSPMFKTRTINIDLIFLVLVI